MAGEADELARALDEHAHVTGEYVRVEQGIYAALSPARTRRGWRLSLAVLSVLVLAAPLGVFVGRAHFVPAAMICPNAANTPGGADGFGGCWPYEGNTGIPAGTTLTDYTGSCTVTAANLVIDSETVNCGLLEIRAANVQISKSLLNGRVFIDPDNFPSASFTITDSRVMGGDALDESGIGNAHFVATRVDVTGGHRSVWCDGDCSVIDSYLHGQETDYTGVEHDGAIR
ncbi:MAG TPA: hypothetical protein VHK64_05470, partial [Nocardioidaceae bacterium]|nr:hypothetical protein [Nocardioidaceae bacterium]